MGANVEALPVWGGLEGLVGSSLLVDCRTPAQWRVEEFRPTEEVRDSSVFSLEAREHFPV